MDSRYWNQRATKDKTSDGFWVADYYCAKSCLQAIQKGLSRLKDINSAVLKTDLWNEGIAIHRDIMRHLPFSNLYGIDISSIVCRKARIQTKHLAVTQGDFRKLPYKNGTMQAIIDLSTLDHVCEADALQVVQGYADLLAYQGILVLAYAQKVYCAKEYWGNLEGVFLFSPAVRNFVKRNFKVIEERGLNLLPNVFMLPPSRFIERLVWHSPKWIQRLFIQVLLSIEKSILSTLIRDFVGMRFIIAIKRKEQK